MASDTTVFLFSDTSILCQNMNITTFITCANYTSCIKESKRDAKLSRPGCTSTREYDYIKYSSLWQLCGGIWERVLGLTDYFGQFLSPQWNTGKFSADSAESSTQDPLGFFAVGRVVLVRIEKGWRHGNPNESFKRGILNLALCLFWGLRGCSHCYSHCNVNI